MVLSVYERGVDLTLLDCLDRTSEKGFLKKLFACTQRSSADPLLVASKH